MCLKTWRTLHEVLGMRSKIAKSLRRMAARQVADPTTTYSTVHVKDVKHSLLDGRVVVVPHYRTTVTRGARRAFYQWLKREYLANRLMVGV